MTRPTMEQVVTAPVVQVFPVPGTIKDLDSFLDFAKKKAEGEVTGDQVRKAWYEFQAAKPVILQDLAKLKKDQLLRWSGMTMSNANRKDEIIKNVWSNFETEWQATPSISYNPFAPNARLNTLEGQLHLWTDELIQQQAIERKERIEARKARTAALKESMNNPRTLEDFQNIFHYRGKDKLTPDQRILYERLLAEKNLAELQKKDLAKRTVQAIDADGIEFELKQTVHTKKGHDVFVVVLNDRVERDKYNQLNARAKKLGGYYSSFRGRGAIPGFQFTTREAAEQFMSLEKVEKEGEARSLERLKEMADRKEAAATEDLHRDRKTNTARRARMAAGVTERLEQEVVTARVLRNIAEGIEAGKIRFLARLQTQTELETLTSALWWARREYVAEQVKQNKLTYDQRTNLEHERFQEKHIAYVRYPYPRLHKSDIPRFVDQLQAKKGFKLIAGRIVKKYRDTISQGNDMLIFSHWSEIKDLKKIASSTTQRDYFIFDRLKAQLLDVDRLQRIGIPNVEILRVALRELLPYLRTGGPVIDPEERRIKELETKLLNYKIRGYVPTPKEIVNKMLDLADINPGDRILEPSAGKGNIVEEIIRRYPNNPLTFIEFDATLVEVLRAKKLPVLHGDFLKHTEKYDKIIMNPPFENRQDIEHIRYAYSLLKPGGRIVAIMSEGAFYGQGKRETAFREFYDLTGVISPQLLPAGTFYNNESRTNVVSRLVVIDKTEGVSGIGCPGRGSCRNRKRRYPNLIGRIHTTSAPGRVECLDNSFSSAAGRGACSRHGGLKQRRGCGPLQGSGDCFAIWFPTAKIRTDEKRFQNRQGKFSQESVDKIVRSFDPNKLDPVTIWRDPRDGNYYILSGHSRLKAHVLLNKERIPARIFQGSEGEAIRYGRVDANRSGTAETIVEDIRAFVLDREGSEKLGVRKLSQGELKTKWGGNYYKLEQYSYLNPRGKFLEILGTPARKNFPYIENKAAWTGYLRKLYPRLTHAHENEIFDFLFSPVGMNMKKEDFFHKADLIINRLDFHPEAPLNLERSANRGTNARADTAPAQARLREIEKELAELKSRRRTANTIEEKKAIDSLVYRLLEEQKRTVRNITNMVQSQTALFGIIIR